MPPAQAADHGHGHDPYDVQAGRADAASPGTAGVLTREFTAAAAALKTPLRVVDLVPLPAPDSTGSSLFFLVIAWMLGGYVGATAVAIALGGMRGPGLRQAAIRLGLLAGYAVISGLLGRGERGRPANLIGPEVAGELYVSSNTVKTHVRSLYAELGTHRRAETVTRARDLGLLAPSARSAR